MQQPLDDGAVDRQLVMYGAFGGVHHQLLPQGAPVFIGRRQLLRTREKLTVAFTQSDSFHSQQRVGHQGGEFGCGGGHLRHRADADDHQRNVDIAAEEAGAVALAMRSAVDAEKHYGAGKSVPMQQLAHRVLGRLAADALLTAHVDGEFRGVAVVAVEVAQRVGAQLRGDQPGTFQGQQSAVGHRGHVVDQRPDLRLDVDRGDRHRRILGQAQRYVAAQFVVGPETGYAAQHYAGRDVLGTEQIEHRVGQKPTARRRRAGARRSRRSTSSTAGSYLLRDPLSEERRGQDQARR